MADYTGKDIRVLSGIEHLRMNPAMYLGPTLNPHHLFQEVLSNSVDEHLNGHGKVIEIELAENNSWVKVVDYARGIPVDAVESGLPAVTAIFTELFSGGKFDRDSGYGIAVGLHGVGLSAVSALSTRVEVEIKRDKKVYKEVYSKGFVAEPLKITGPTKISGTSIKIEADPEIFDSILFESEFIQTKLRDLSFLVPTCEFRFKQGETEKVFKSSGLSELLFDKIQSYTISGKRAEKISEVQYLQNYALDTTRTETNRHETDLAFCFTNSEYLHNYSFCNCLRNIDGGTHETAIKKIFFAVIQKYFVESDKFEYSLEDLQSGVWLVIHLKLAEKPEFSSQTKEKLISKTSYNIIQISIETDLINWCKNNQDTLKKVFTLAQNRYYARQQSAKLQKLASKIKVNFSGKPQRGKIEGLTDCKCARISDTEIFLLEGDSAAGSAKQARGLWSNGNNETGKDLQAILPLQGKVPNSSRCTESLILKNEEFRLLLNALGCGYGKSCNPELLRYGKVIILTDADPDGSHIASLLASFFLNYLRPLVERGLVYVVDGPLYCATKGKERVYAYTKSELDDKLNGSGGWNIVRAKGWGEMNPDVLKDIAMNPDSRKLIQLQFTDETIFQVDSIMGADSGARKLLLSDLR